MLDAVGLIRPPLAREPRMYENDASGNEKGRYGRFEAIARADDRYVASGWAVLPNRGERADGVVLAFRSPDTPWIALTMAGLRTAGPDLSRLYDRRAKDTGWTASFPKEVIPSEAHELSAWAIDAKTGKSYKLEGTQSVW